MTNDSDTLTKTYGLVQRIDERTENTEKALDRAFVRLDNHGKRIRKLESRDAVHDQQLNIIQRNPGKTIAIGGVSLTTILGVVVAIITKLMEMW